MSNDEYQEVRQELDETLIKLKKTISDRLRKQFKRHFSVSPHADLHKIIDLQISQEREWLLKLQQTCEENEQFGVGDFYQQLIDEWLPEISMDFHSKYR